MVRTGSAVVAVVAVLLALTLLVAAFRGTYLSAIKTLFQPASGDGKKAAS